MALETIKAAIQLGGGRAGLFPNRHHALHFGDDELTGGKGLFTVRGDCFNPEGWFAGCHATDAMDEPN